MMSDEVLTISICERFLQLPLDFFTQLFNDHLDWTDISNIDKALTNTILRPIYMNVISDKLLVFNELLFNEKHKYMNNALIWIGNRKLNINNIYISGYLFFTNHIVTDKGLIGLSKHCYCRSLTISGCKDITDIGT